MNSAHLFLLIFAISVGIIFLTVVSDVYRDSIVHEMYTMYDETKDILKNIAYWMRH